MQNLQVRYLQAVQLLFLNIELRGGTDINDHEIGWRVLYDTMVTPEISGLQNNNALQAMFDSGNNTYSYIHTLYVSSS